MMLGMSEKKSIQITSEAMEAVDRILGVYGVRITKRDLIERVLLWMDAQSDVVKGSILGTLPPSHRADVARMELERLISSAPGTDSPEEGDERTRARNRVGAKVRGGLETPPKAPPVRQ